MLCEISIALHGTEGKYSAVKWGQAREVKSSPLMHTEKP